MNRRMIAAALAAALAVPATAAADPGKRRDHSKPATAKGHAKHGAKAAKKVTFVFTGAVTADGAIDVRGGNAHARRSGFVGQTVTFDFTTAKVLVADTNADQRIDVTDVRAGDRVLVRARLSRGTKYDAAEAKPLVAGALIQKTKAPIEDAPEGDAS